MGLTTHSWGGKLSPTHKPDKIELTVVIVFDFDDTISPTKIPEGWDVEHETVRFVYTLRIPSYVLRFLRGRNDIALLSSWGESVGKIAELFNFDATVLTMEDGMGGVKGKYEVVRGLAEKGEATAWVDDHAKPWMVRELKQFGVTTIIPHGGVVTENQLKRIA